MFQLGYNLLLIEAITTHAQPPEEETEGEGDKKGRVDKETHLASVQWFVFHFNVFCLLFLQFNNRVKQFHSSGGLSILLSTFSLVSSCPSSLPHLASLAILEKLIHIFLTKPPGLREEGEEEEIERFFLFSSLPQARVISFFSSANNIILV